MALKELYGTIGELHHMNRTLARPVLAELREGNLPNPRQRIEKIQAMHPNTGRVSSFGGNSSLFVYHNGRKKERWVSGVSTNMLHGPDRLQPRIAIFRFGIEGTDDAGIPIFENPDHAKRMSIAVESPSNDMGKPWLQQQFEPLFNVDEDGVVFARVSDIPTAIEMQLFYEILEQFEVGSIPPTD